MKDLVLWKKISYCEVLPG